MQEYAAAFRTYGVDVDALDPAQAGLTAGGEPGCDRAGECDRSMDFHSQVTGDARLSWSTEALGRGESGGPRSMAHPASRNTRRDGHTTGAVRSRNYLRLAATADAGQLPEASVTRLAFALSSLGSRETAIALLRRSQRAHPDDFWLNMDLGRELSTTGQHEEAGRFFSAAVAIRPRSSLAHSSLAMCFEKSGRLEEAADTFRQAILLRPGRPTSARAGWGQFCWPWEKSAWARGSSSRRNA